jgi:hypothetical protein
MSCFVRSSLQDDSICDADKSNGKPIVKRIFPLKETGYSLLVSPNAWHRILENQLLK